MHLKWLWLFRQNVQADVLDVTPFLQEQLSHHGMFLGYKCVLFEMYQADLVVNQRTVWHLIKILDPQGVRQQNHLRQHLYTNPGHNFLWQWPVWGTYPVSYNNEIFYHTYKRIFSHSYEIFPIKLRYKGVFFFYSVNAMCFHKNTTLKCESW